MIFDWLSKINQLHKDRIPFAMVTLVDVEVSAPQEIGARAIFTKEGLFWGTVGGGKAEAKAMEYALRMLGESQDRRQMVKWNLKKDVGMTCGGTVSLFFETFAVGCWSVVVFGAGHVAQALVPILDTFLCQVTVIDSRQEWLDRLPPSPRRTLVLRDRLEEEVPRLRLGSFFLSLTQGHGTDLPVVEAILRLGRPAYLGVIGSKAKALVLKRGLRERGLEQDLIDCLHCPVGLAIGDRRPAEIAVSIAAELLQVRDLCCSFIKPTIS